MVFGVIFVFDRRLIAKQSHSFPPAIAFHSRTPSFSLEKSNIVWRGGICVPLYGCLGRIYVRHNTDLLNNSNDFLQWYADFVRLLPQIHSITSMFERRARARIEYIRDTYIYPSLKTAKIAEQRQLGEWSNTQQEVDMAYITYQLNDVALLNNA